MVNPVFCFYIFGLYFEDMGHAWKVDPLTVDYAGQAGLMSSYTFTCFLLFTCLTILTNPGFICMLENAPNWIFDNSIYVKGIVVGPGVEVSMERSCSSCFGWQPGQVQLNTLFTTVLTIIRAISSVVL
ncbi:hypothetical protein BDQ17DRAFT_114621 [Cyathus striatus]|nr:hypothetical protein BDQ17DRAFT_114621 [Cyathus striatus]